MSDQNKCLVCGKRDGEKAMVFRMMPWCSERHRKIIEGEVKPSRHETVTMNETVFGAIRAKWDL